jgi:hypothetical protein
MAETKISVTISTDLRAILSGVEVSTQTAALIDIPKTEIDFNCEGYSVGGLAGMRPTASFSPNVIKGNRLMSWAVPWSVPYRIMNFVYLTSPEVRYIIVDDSGVIDDDSLADQLYAALPQKTVTEDGQENVLINKNIITSVTTITDLNNYKVRFVFFSDPSSYSPTDLLDSKHDITAIWIKPESLLPSEKKLKGYGTVTYYSGSAATSFTLVDSTYYLGLPSLLATVFAEDIESYNCNMQRAFKRMEFITDIYLERTKDLHGYYALNYPSSSCLSPYSLTDAQDRLGWIKTDANELFNRGLASSQIINIYTKAYSEISGNLGLSKLNDMAQQLSCPEIY